MFASVVQAAAREAKEREKRDEIIRQIRALDATTIDRTVILDHTETAGFGFLGEMSFAELQERLAMLKAREAREEAKRRDQIAHEKREQDVELRRKIDTIAIGETLVYVQYAISIRLNQGLHMHQPFKNFIACVVSN